MAVAKCLVKLAKASKLCESLISKEFLVMISLIEEPLGLRGKDIHFILGGNKSWVSNLCSKLSLAGLASSKRDGREVYYKLTAHGKEVAEKALALIESLIKTEKMEYILEENSYLLDPEILKPTPQINPNYTHEGAALLNKTESYFFFIGKDRRGRPLIIDLQLKDLQNIELKFDNFYKRRNSLRFKPLILSYTELVEGKVLQKKVYLFIDFKKIARTTKNRVWREMLLEEFEKIQSSELESEHEVLSTIENVGE